MSNTDSTTSYICPSCSAENRANAKFCRQCGQARKMDFALGEKTMEAIVCTSCQTEIRASDLFCLTCGAKQGPRPTREKHCLTCNKQLPVNANFCTQCGGKLVDAVANVVPPRSTAVPNLEA